MNRFVSSFKLKYLENIVYMLQSVRYKPAPFIRWYWRVSDFSIVQHRSTIKFTPKARLLWVIAWSLRASLWAFAIAIIAKDRNILLAPFIVLLEPIVTAHILLIPLSIGDILITKPREKNMVRIAAEILQNTSAKKIVVAGSYGKTSMKEILSSLLGDSNLKTAATPGNMNTMIGISRFANSLKGDEEVLIIELGESQPGDIDLFCKFIQPDIAVLTGIAEAHMENFKTIQAVVANFKALNARVETLYANGENTLIAKNFPDANLYGSNGCGEISVVNGSIVVSVDSTAFKVKCGKTTKNLSIQLLGQHQIGPVVGALQLCQSLGANFSQLIESAQTITPHPGRLQPEKLEGGVWVINDGYNGNPIGVTAVINYLKTVVVKGRKIYMTPGLVEMGEQTKEIHIQIGKQLAPVADLVILMQNSVTDFIQEGLKLADYTGEIEVVSDPLVKLQTIPLWTKNGDLLVLQNDWTDGLQ